MDVDRMAKIVVSPTELEGVLLLQPEVFADSRGFFYESYRQSYTELGLPPMVQVNVSRSQAGVLRGLHLQLERPQAKLITVSRGRIWDVAVDLRIGSPQFGRWCAQVLSDQDPQQLFIPAGFAHGYCVLSDEADLLYQCSDYYHAQSEVGILWSDATLDIPWPVKSPRLSDKDSRNLTVKQAESASLLPIFFG
jgi:dTDP-4-dehydrorhamnose 3,5-epimerase